jgi:hypothetical protein
MGALWSPTAYVYRATASLSQPESGGFFGFADFLENQLIEVNDPRRGFLAQDEALSLKRGTGKAQGNFFRVHVITSPRRLGLNATGHQSNLKSKA